MHINAIVAAPIRVELDVPEGLPAEEIKARIVERAHWLANNNGLHYEILDCSLPSLANHEVLNSLPLIPWVEYVPVDPADWNEQAEVEVSRACEHRCDEDDYVQGSGDWPD